ELRPNNGGNALGRRARDQVARVESGQHRPSLLRAQIETRRARVGARSRAAVTAAGDGDRDEEREQRLLHRASDARRRRRDSTESTPRPAASENLTTMTGCDRQSGKTEGELWAQELLD